MKKHIELLGKPCNSTSVLEALPGKLDIKILSPSNLFISASLAMSTRVLEALPGKLDIKRHSPSILYVSASLAISSCVLQALPGKLDIKMLSPSILHILASLAIQQAFLKPCLVILISKYSHLVFSVYWQVKHTCPYWCTLCALWIDPPISTVTLIPSQYEPWHVISNNMVFWQV